MFNLYDFLKEMLDTEEDFTVEELKDIVDKVCGERKFHESEIRAAIWVFIGRGEAELTLDRKVKKI